MNQTFLLGTLYRVVRAVEIGHQDSGEVLKHRLDGAALPGRSIEISDLLHAGDNPYIAIIAHDTGAGFVDMKQVPAGKPV